MELIPRWRLWYRRWSTWLLATLSGFSFADINGFMPNMQQYIDPQWYKWIMFGLTVATFIAIHIRQPSVSGGPNGPDSRRP